MTEAKDEVRVQPIKTYGGDDGLQYPQSEAYSVSRARAAELYANGLISYVNKADTPAPKEKPAPIIQPVAAAEARSQDGEEVDEKARDPAHNKKAKDPANKAG